jgi:F-type H+-transporting ATPase subunit delta
MENISAARYGKALFEAGVESNELDVFLEQLKDVSSIITGNKELMEIFSHPEIRYEEKKKIISNIFDNRVQTEIVKLLWLLVEHEKINEIKSVYNEFKKLAYDYKGMKIAYVKTAVPMTEEEVEILGQKLSAKYNKQIEIEQEVDPSVIGGVFLKVEDEVTDGTVRGRLEAMSKELFEAR